MLTGRSRPTTLATLALLAGLGMVTLVATRAYRQLSSFAETERWISHTHEVLETAQAMTIALGDAIAARRAFALTKSEAALEPYRAALTRVASTRAALRRLTADNPGQQRLLDELDPVVDSRIRQLEEAVGEARTTGFSAERERSLTTAGDSLTTRLYALVAELEKQERALLEKRQEDALAESELVKRTMVIGFGASIVLLGMAFLYSRREIQRRVRSEAALAERERRLGIILSSIGDGVIATDSRGLITHLNPVAEQVSGWSLAEAAGKPFSEVFRIINERTRAPEPDPVGRVLRERAKVGLAQDTVLLARDGSERPIADSAAPIVDDQGELQGAVIVFRDVTETRDVEARFRHLVEAAPDAILIADADGRIVVANDQASALFGYSVSELIGQPVEMLMPERLRGRHAEHRHRYHAVPAVRAMGTGLPLVASRKDGTVCPVEVSLSPLQTSEGIQVIAAVRDVTRRRELERFRDEYVGYISHDLKNPLSIISLQTRLLARWQEGRGAAADEKQAVGVIAESAAFIDHLVRDLLEMAYVESEHVELHFEHVELAGFLESVLGRTVSTSDRSRVHLEVVEACTVSAESRRLERVVVNFVQNAIKYSPPGSTIRVRLDVRDDRAVVSVIDSGSGVAAEDRPHIFNKYRRTSAAKSKEGLGLGLYICRKIIEAHHGEIGVEGAAGEGATFFFKLPRVAAMPSQEPQETAAPPIGHRLRGLKVLLVDDEVNAVSALSALLGYEGLDVRTATAGETALALAASERPDVAVVDVQMPGMSGLMLLERLRQQYPGLPAVIMSGHMEHHAGIAEVRQKDGAAYISKPVDVDELLRTLDRLFLARASS